MTEERVTGEKLSWERLWRPRWAGGWTAARWLYAVAALRTHLPRLPTLTDAYASQDMVFTRDFMRVSDFRVLDALDVHLLWGAALAGILGLLWGGRLAKPGLLLWLLSTWILLGAEALNTKAYDRLLTWEALALLLGPIGERGLTEKGRGPVGRWVMLVIFCAIYGSTGWLKLLDEPRWLDGSVLAYHLVDVDFGNTVLGAWISGQRWLCAALGCFTIAFEASFPVLVWLPRVNPWLLLLGVGFHVGIGTTMNVGSFSWVALAAYPVLLHPEWAERQWERLLGWWATRRGARRVEVTG